MTLVSVLIVVVLQNVTELAIVAIFVVIAVEVVVNEVVIEVIYW